MTFTDGEKKRYIETFSLCRTTEGGVEISVANFPDEDFRTAIATFDIDNNGYLCDAEAGMIKSLELSGTKSLVGIEYLTSLEQLTLKNIAPLILREVTRRYVRRPRRYAVQDIRRSCRSKLPADAP